MKSNAEFTQEIIRKTKQQRKKRRILFSVVACYIVSALSFFIGYSNIITLDFSRHSDSYLRYLVSYVSQDEEFVALRFIDNKNAVVRINEKTYPCALQAETKDEFTLTVTADAGLQTLNTQSKPSISAETPSVFRVEFWDSNAKISWNILGVKIEKILSITEECDVPTGLWSLFATQLESGPWREVTGGGWTLILENGDSYTGEGASSAYRSKFIAVGNTLFQCLFDSVSGIIVDASEFEYDDKTFDFPIIKERYLSDGDPCYFYSRLLTEKETVDFQGGTFTAAKVIYGVEDHFVEPNFLIKETATWQLLPKTTSPASALDVTAKLQLDKDHSAQLRIQGNSQHNGTFDGIWYALKHSVLVVLNEKNDLTGRVFTLYTDSNFSIQPSGENIQNYAVSRIESADCYKVGYHTFSYHVAISETQIYWGDAWTPEKLTPTLRYETPYVLYGQYYYDHYDGDWEKQYEEGFRFEDSMLVDLPTNGIQIIFHQDDTATVTYPDGKILTKKFTLSPNSGMIEFNVSLEIYQGKNAISSLRPHHVNSNYVVKTRRLYLENGALYYEYVIGHSYGMEYNYDVTHCRLWFQPIFE